MLKVDTTKAGVTKATVTEDMETMTTTTMEAMAMAATITETTTTTATTIKDGETRADMVATEEDTDLDTVVSILI